MGDPGKTSVQSDQHSGAVKVVVATTVMLSFLSFWRAAAIVLSDLASSVFYVGGIAETAVGKSAPRVHPGDHAVLPPSACMNPARRPCALCRSPPPWWSSSSSGVSPPSSRTAISRSPSPPCIRPASPTTPWGGKGHRLIAVLEDGGDT